jgi:hypothetical protein
MFNRKSDRKSQIECGARFKFSSDMDDPGSFDPPDALQGTFDPLAKIADLIQPIPVSLFNQ